MTNDYEELRRAIEALNANGADIIDLTTFRRACRSATIARLLSELDATRAQRDRINGMFCRLVAQLGDKANGQDAPGHCHRVKGVWDQHNGAKSGTKCEWCALWAEAVAISREVGHG